VPGFFGRGPSPESPKQATFATNFATLRGYRTIRKARKR
jgi:hypothetical protein